MEHAHALDVDGRCEDKGYSSQFCFLCHKFEADCLNKFCVPGSTQRRGGLDSRVHMRFLNM